MTHVRAVLHGGKETDSRRNPHFALGVEDDGLRARYAEDLVPAPIQRDAHSGREVEVQLRYLCIQLGSWGRLCGRRKKEGGRREMIQREERERAGRERHKR